MTSLEECFVALKEMLGREGVANFADLAEHEISKCHFGLGRRIRNAWGLWDGSELKSYLEGLGLTHPDDMSSVILTSFWRHLHNLPLEIEQQVAYYRKYWEKLT